MPSDTSLVGKDLRGSDLRASDLSDKVLFHTDLRTAKLYGARISLRCEQFDSVKLDDVQVAELLLMIAQADINPIYVEGLECLVKSIIEKPHYDAIKRMMRIV